MLEKMKEWLFDENEEINDERINEIESYGVELIKRDINDLNQLADIGDDFKKQKILLYYFSKDIIIRSLDFISGLCFVLQFQTIKITDDIYLFLPEKIIYKPNS